MRVAVLAFAAGVICLQFQPVLPTWAAWCWLGVLPWFLPRRGSGWRVVLVCLGCFFLGFGYASWRAELRLADALERTSVTNTMVIIISDIRICVM